MADLIVDDENLEEIGNYFKEFSSKLQLYLDEYTNILGEIKAEAIISGDISNTLDAFIMCAKALNSSISDLGIEIKNSVDRYLEEIDEKDQYLY